jgi:hypothetical protein
MPFFALATAVLVVVVAALSLAVLSLRRQLREVTSQLADLSSRPDAPHLPAVADVAPVYSLPDTRTDVDLVPTARVASVTLGGPMIKVAAFSYGVRHALREEHRVRMAYLMRKELRRQLKLRRMARRRSHVREGWES